MQEKEFIEEMRRMLEQRLYQLLPVTVMETCNHAGDHSRRFSDPVDAAVFHANRELYIEIRDRRCASVNKIMQSLKRIQEGSFGICDECGDDIGKRRLQAHPHTARCIHCQMMAEKMRRARGVTPIANWRSRRL